MGEVGKERWCVVIGDRGFEKRRLVEMLLKDKGRSVCVVDLEPTIPLDPNEESGVLDFALKSGWVTYVSTDLRNKAQVVKAFKGAEVVFHMAAPVNVEETKNVIDACVECNVKRLVYTSTPSIIFDGVHGIHNGKESLPYPETFSDSYSETKAEGEKLVIKANGKNELLTCCMLPSSIIGLGDKLLVPTLASLGKTANSKFMNGNWYDFTYAENVAHGLICAERALAFAETPDKVAGQRRNITRVNQTSEDQHVVDVQQGQDLNNQVHDNETIKDRVKGLSLLVGGASVGYLFSQMGRSDSLRVLAGIAIVTSLGIYLIPKVMDYVITKVVAFSSLVRMLKSYLGAN